jgi:hypothetical protein
MRMRDAGGNAFGIAFGICENGVLASCTDGRTYLRRAVLTSERNLAFVNARRGAEEFLPKWGKAMRDWEGTRVRAEAQQVPCRYCLARAGDPCTAKGDPKHLLEAFPAHTVRIKDSQKVVADDAR